MDKQMLGAVVITVALGAAVAGAEVLLINEMVEAEQRTEVRFDWGNRPAPVFSIREAWKLPRVWFLYYLF